MPEAPNGQATANDFDWYEDKESANPIGVPAHPCLLQLQGDSAMPAKKILPAKIISGVRQNPSHSSVKRKSSRLASIASKTVKKVKITLHAKAIESNDLETPDDEGEGEASEQRAP